MASITLFAPMAMATTQLARVIPVQDACNTGPEIRMEHTALHMSWVVATDDKGKRTLRMQWEPSA